jgi:transposase-like protein
VVFYVAFEPHLRRIVYMRFFDAANMLTTLIFIKKIRAIYGLMIALTDGAQYYRAACRMLNLKHYVYDSRQGT